MKLFATLSTRASAKPPNRHIWSTSSISVPKKDHHRKDIRMISLYGLSTFVAFILPVFGSSYDLDSLTDSLLQEVLGRLEPDDPLYGLSPHGERSNLNQYPGKVFEVRRDAILSREPSIRDQEYLEHSSIFGHQLMQGGAGEGPQRLKPDGSIQNMEIVKSDKQLPSYCTPPNPCPIGYTESDGCLVNFENTATFSRDYEAAQECMCDSEHMFDCPGSSRENEIDALARTFENEGLAEAALDRLMKSMEPLNPYLEGEKLPVVAKKAPKSSIK